MDKLQARSKFREHLVKIAKDSVIDRVSKLFLAQYRSQLEHVPSGGQIPPHVPVGKDKFVNWLKDTLNNYFPEVSGVVENEKVLKEYAAQVADSIAKSNTDVQNPLRDYEVSKDPVYIRAQENNQETLVKISAEEKSFVPSGSLKTENMYASPEVHTRYCPDHPGVMLRRVKDNLYQCPVSGDLASSGFLRDNYDYAGGHEVKFEMGVQNQTTEGMNEIHPLLPFLYEQPKQKPLSTSKPYDVEKLYGVKATPPQRQELKNASILDTLTIKVASCGGCNGSCGCGCQSGGTCSCNLEKQAEKNKKQTKSAQQLFAPTTMTSRQCPDHPGQQLVRLEDGVRQCPLDSKVYDFHVGFTTEDGTKHNGGTVEAQNSFGPNFRLATAANKLGGIDTPTTHQFLWKVLQSLPATAQDERRVLNYKFERGVSLEDAISAIKQADELTKKPQEQQPSDNSEVASFARS